MTEQETQPQQLPESYHKIDVDKAIQLRLKGLTYREIAKQFDCTHSAVIQRISRLLPDTMDIQSFKQHRADILAAKQGEILQSLTVEDIKSSSAYQRVGMFGILYDKERLERGQSTGNIAYLDLSKDIAERAKRLRELEQQLGMDPTQDAQSNDV